MNLYRVTTKKGSKIGTYSSTSKNGAKNKALFDAPELSKSDFVVELYYKGPKKTVIKKSKSKTKMKKVMSKRAFKLLPKSAKRAVTKVARKMSKRKRVYRRKRY